VDGNWEPSPAQQGGEQEDDYVEEAEILEPIYGCTEEDIGWVRIAP
jgi:hypothetical protein